MAIAELCEQQREIANALFSSAGEAACCEQNRGNSSCIQDEEDKPLNKVEKKRGWERRPFFAYDTGKMCNACAAYFHAECAAQLLHQMHCQVVRCAARKAATV